MNAHPATEPEPRSPMLTIVLYADGSASVGGVPVQVPRGADLTEVRTAAVETAAGIAGSRGESMYTVAIEPDGSVWPLLIHPDGRVEEAPEEDAYPRPFPGGPDAAGEPAPDAHQPSSGPVPPAPPPPVPGPPEDAGGGREGGAAVQPPQPPQHIQDRLDRISASGETGHVEAAATMAVDLEKTVVSVYGEEHPYTLHVRAIRAHIAVLALDWPRAADLYLQIAEAWMRTSGAHNSQTRVNATNAHACWRYIQDRREAERVGEAMTLLWSRIPGAESFLRRAGRRMRMLRQ